MELFIWLGEVVKIFIKYLSKREMPSPSFPSECLASMIYVMLCC
jgi:hypothetical protein